MGQSGAIEQLNRVIDCSENTLFLARCVVLKARLVAPVKGVEPFNQSLVHLFVSVGHLEEGEYPLDLVRGVLQKVFVLDDQDGVTLVGHDPFFYHELPAGYLLLEKLHPLLIGS